MPIKIYNAKAYTLLWERCDKAMKNKIKARLDYIKIKNNPIKLLIVIKEHALSYQENRCSMSIILDVIQTLLNTKCGVIRIQGIIIKIGIKGCMQWGRKTKM